MNTTSRSTQRYLPIAITALVAVAYVYYAVIRDPMGTVMSLLSDDAFYYFKIASNIVSGSGCTFDGIAPTNGFHPLWMLVMVAVYRVAGADPITPVTVVVVLNLFLCLATFTILYRVVDRYVAPGYAWVTVAACLLPNILTGMLNGLETGLMMLMAVWLLNLLYRDRLLEPAAPPTSTFGLGFLFGVVTLCRLDAVFLFAAAVVMTVASVAIRKADARAGLARAALMCGGFGLAVAPYFVWNVASFGHLSPISGTVKSTFPSVSAQAFEIGGDKRFGALMLALISGLLALAFFAGQSRERDWKEMTTSPLLLLTLACVLHFANTVLFLEWGVYWWHYALYGLALAMAAAKAAHRVTAGRAWTRRLTVTLVVVPLVVVAVAAHSRILRIKGEQHRGWLEGAEWVREHTQPGTVLAAMDAGIIGYFSRRPVINLDGKANGYDYLRRLREGDVEGYLISKNTAYLVNVRGIYHDGSMRIFIPRAGRPYSQIVVTEEYEVFRSSEIPSSIGRIRDAARTHLYIWEYVPHVNAPTQ